MNQENKLSLDEVYIMLCQRIGDEFYPREFFNDLLSCWRQYRCKFRAGRDGWMKRKEAEDFLHYAY